MTGNASVEAEVPIGLPEQILLLMEVHVQSAHYKGVRAACESEVVTSDEDFGCIGPGPGRQIVIQSIDAGERNVRDLALAILGEQLGNRETRGPLKVSVQRKIQRLISPTHRYLIDSAGTECGRQLTQIQLGVVLEQCCGGWESIAGPQIVCEVLIAKEVSCSGGESASTR